MVVFPAGDFLLCGVGEAETLVTETVVLISLGLCTIVDF